MFSLIVSKAANVGEHDGHFLVGATELNFGVGDHHLRDRGREKAFERRTLLVLARDFFMGESVVDGGARLRSQQGEHIELFLSKSRGPLQVVDVDDADQAVGAPAGARTWRSAVRKF